MTDQKISRTHRSPLAIAHDLSGRVLSNILSAERIAAEFATQPINLSTESAEHLRLTKSNLIGALQHVDALLGIPQRRP